MHYRIRKILYKNAKCSIYEGIIPTTVVRAVFPVSDHPKASKPRNCFGRIGKQKGETAPEIPIDPAAGSHYTNTCILFQNK
jgi:hypothetical protein